MTANSPETTAGIDSLLEAMSHERRRLALRCLYAHRHSTLADLAEFVAEKETTEPFEELSAAHVRDVYFELYHRHVPELEKCGLVTYDEEVDIVSADSDIEDAVETVRREVGHVVTECD